MTKKQYLDELESQLYFLDEAARTDVLREFESHMDDTQAARPELDEAQIVDRLPPPASVAASYYSEGAERQSKEDERGRKKGGFRFSLGGMERLFRFARRDERELSGDDVGVERVECTLVACDVSAVPGDGFSYRISGRWDDGDEPRITRQGGVWKLDGGNDADSLELTLPPGLVELIVSTVSGDVNASLPEGANMAIRTVSGDVSCTVAGGALTVGTASGDVSVKGSTTDAEVSSASGDLSIRGITGRLKAGTQSGDVSVYCADPDADVDASTLSGDVSVHLAEGSAAEISAESVSGDVSAPGARRGAGLFGAKMLREGGPARVSAKSVSGDVSVR